MVTGFAADGSNCDNDCLWIPKNFYALNCSELLIFMFLVGHINHPGEASFRYVFEFEIEREFPVRVYIRKKKRK